MYAMVMVVVPFIVTVVFIFGTHQSTANPLRNEAAKTIFTLLLSDIVNKELPKGVLSKHLRLVWLVERSAWIKGTVLQYRAIMLPNVGITHVLGKIFMRVIKRILLRNRGG